jgi:hypothetical protein
MCCGTAKCVTLTKEQPNLLSGISYTEFHPLLSRNIAITGGDFLALLSTGTVFRNLTDIPQRFEKCSFTEFHTNLKSKLVPKFIKT